MIIFKVNVEGFVGFESERDSPVSANRNTPGAGAIAFQSVQAIAGQVHICCSPSTVKHIQLSTESVGKVSRHAATLARFKESFQSFMPKALYHRC